MISAQAQDPKAVAMPAEKGCNRVHLKTAFGMFWKILCPWMKGCDQPVLWRRLNAAREKKTEGMLVHVRDGWCNPTSSVVQMVPHNHSLAESHPSAYLHWSASRTGQSPGDMARLPHRRLLLNPGREQKWDNLPFAGKTRGTGTTTGKARHVRPISGHLVTLNKGKPERELDSPWFNALNFRFLSNISPFPFSFCPFSKPIPPFFPVRSPETAIEGDISAFCLTTTEHFTTRVLQLLQCSLRTYISDFDIVPFQRQTCSFCT